MNTNEIPGELSCENLVSSHVKITCYLQVWKSHCCYGYVINHTFHTKKLLKWNGLVVHWCLYKYVVVWVLKKYFTCSLHSLVKYFSTLKEKFRISMWPCNVLYICNNIKDNFLSEPEEINVKFHKINLTNEIFRMLPVFS